MAPAVELNMMITTVARGVCSIQVAMMRVMAPAIIFVFVKRPRPLTYRRTYAAHRAPALILCREIYARALKTYARLTLKLQILSKHVGSTVTNLTWTAMRNMTILMGVQEGRNIRVVRLW